MTEMAAMKQQEIARDVCGPRLDCEADASN
jgi:hypothetical protein